MATLIRFCTPLNGLRQTHVKGVQTFLALFQLESDQVVLADLIHQPCNVDEVLLIGFIVPNESITFGLIEKLNCTFFHENK